MKTTAYIANKLKAEDSDTGRDKWKITKLVNCEYKRSASTHISDRQSDALISFICLVPFNNDYLPYRKWKQALNGYTISVGDYIFLEKPTENATADNIVKLHRKFSDTSFEVKSFDEVQKRLGVNYQLKVVG